MRKSFALAASIWAFAATGASAGEHLVTQADKQFAPDDLTINVGDTVTFKNTDSVTHNVMSRSVPNKFNLGSQKQGEAESHRFDVPGEVKVRCAIHPKMKMTIKVVE